MAAFARREAAPTRAGGAIEMPRVWWLLSMVLAGCVPDAGPDLHAMPAGRYPNYRAVLVEKGLATSMVSGTPDAVRKRFAECGSDFILSGIAPLDRILLDK